jgi:hypothetical protein
MEEPLGEAYWHPGGWTIYELPAEELSKRLAEELRAGRLVVVQYRPPAEETPEGAFSVLLASPAAAAELEQRFHQSEQVRWAEHSQVVVDSQVLKPPAPRRPPLEAWWRCALGNLEQAAEQLSRWSGRTVTVAAVKRFRAWLQEYTKSRPADQRRLRQQAENLARRDAVLYRSVVEYLRQRGGARPTRGSEPTLARSCVVCGNLFAPRTAQQVVCSRTCRAEWLRRRRREKYWSRPERFRAQARTRMRRWRARRRQAR